MSIDLAVERHIATITINRPERMNAMDAEHYAALSAAWVRVRDDSEIRVAVVTGAGENSFTAGADLKSFVGAPPALSDLLATQKNQLLNRGLEVWKPVVAAINGYCLGGGMTLLLATDLRIAAAHATFIELQSRLMQIPRLKRYAMRVVVAVLSQVCAKPLKG
jgi:E-phenylitaconyl-CoA hydratase